MGVGPFRCCSVNRDKPAPNPDPSRWKLINKVEFENSYVLMVRYLDCMNFEGVKIMVYRGKYQYRDELDPHFEDSEMSPIARFKPTEYEWAVDFASKLSKEGV